MIDTHSHLYYPDFADDLDAVIARAQEAGVGRIITAGVDRATSEQCLQIAARYPAWCLPPSACILRKSIKPAKPICCGSKRWRGIRALVAIGEIGLDIYRGETNLARQEVVFTRLLELARQTALPVIIHHRAAGTRTIEIIEAKAITRGVFHCFSEDEAYARRVLAPGLNVSFTGNLTYKNSPLPALCAAAAAGAHAAGNGRAVYGAGAVSRQALRTRARAAGRAETGRTARRML